ncbi:MAG: short chain dehydrogenase [Gammaproteobacteria bacterium]|nr:MAG: short chain dehydrogenase [Gammaproteobacteria bacterium]RLA52016.1 MAG: short chain dehydrogenase [Gammaproteobacteria bacterium]
MKDKIVLITGAGSGIGRESALLFAAEGAKVVVSDINAEAGEGTVELVKQAGGDATFIKCDVSKGPQVEALVQGTVDTYGRLDAAFNNAGVEGDTQATTITCTEENFDLNIAVNLKGVWWCMKYEIEQFLRQESPGAIVNTSSLAGLKGVPRGNAYVAAKHGVIGMTKSASLEFARKDIRVNAVCPGAIETPMLDRIVRGSEKGYEAMRKMEPVGRLGKPSEIAEAVVWLCSDKASFVTGLAMSVDGGSYAR